MKAHPTRRLLPIFALTLAAALLCAAAPEPPAQAEPAARQMPPEVTELAQRTADAVAKLKPQHVLIAPLRICMLNSQLCDERNEALRAALQKVLPGVSFVNWAAAVKLLPK